MGLLGYKLCIYPAKYFQRTFFWEIPAFPTLFLNPRWVNAYKRLHVRIVSCLLLPVHIAVPVYVVWAGASCTQALDTSKLLSPVIGHRCRDLWTTTGINAPAKHIEVLNVHFGISAFALACSQSWSNFWASS